MKHENHIILIGALVAMIAATPCFGAPKEFAGAAVQPQIARRCEPFDYSSQKIDGLLGARLQLNQMKGLLEAPYYSYLRGYRPGVEILWHSGEYLGKYAQALAGAYRYTRDQRFLELAMRIVDTWIDAQAADGYLGTAGKLPKKDRWEGWTTWEHAYVLRGLIAYYDVSIYDRQRFKGSDRLALEAAEKVGRLLASVYGDREGQRDLMTTGFNGLGGGSVLEPMVYLYQRTGNVKHLDFCHYILRAFEQPNGPQIVSELTERSGKVNHVKSRKAYEMLECIIGILRMYELNGERSYLNAAQAAWNDIHANRLYITGTASQDEAFCDDLYLPADETDLHINRHGERAPIDTGEACVTVHWMDLNRHLFHLSGDLKYVEEIEKSLYNHLLGSQHPESARQSYYTALIGHKHYNSFNPYSGKPPCCMTSVTRCLTQLPEMFWTRFADNGLAVLLYESGEVADQVRTTEGKEVRVSLKVVADVMGAGRVRMTVKPEAAATFRLALRVPSWVSAFEVRLSNGESFAGTPGKFLELNRSWSGAETLDISMRLVEQTIEGGPTYAGYYAFKRGPFVLALDAELNPGLDIDRVTVAGTTTPKLESVGQSLPTGWIGGQAYAIESAEGKRLTLVPFMDAGQNGSKYRVWIRGRDAIK